MERSGRKRKALALAGVAIVVLVALAAPAPGPLQPALTAADGSRVPETGRLSPRRVTVSELLPAATAAAAAPRAQTPRDIPRRLPAYGVRATDERPQPPSATALAGATGEPFQTAGAPTFQGGFDGLDSTHNPFPLTPPDPQLAVGPDHVVEFVNVTGRITDKDGIPLGPDFLLRDFFLLPPDHFWDFDPKIIYDDISDRFFASYVSQDFFGDGHLHLAVSGGTNPLDFWTVYTIAFPDAIPDYPGIGITNDKLTVSYNLFNPAGILYMGEQTLVVQKSDMLAGAVADIAAFPVNTVRFTVRPAHNLSSGNDQYLTTWHIFSNNKLTVIRITGTPELGNVTEVSATNLTTLVQATPPASITAGPGAIESGDFRVLETIWRDNRLWSASSARCVPPPGLGMRSCLHLTEIGTGGASSILQDIMLGAVDQYFSWPAIRTDSSGNLFVVFTATHSGIYAGVRVAGRLASDPLGSISVAACPLKAGEVVHDSGRWGDYQGAAVDPADPSRVWVVGEYAKDDGLMNWGTYISSMDAASGDCDGDNFPDSNETFMTTDGASPCPATGAHDAIDNDGDTAIDEVGEGANDENPDAWPPDADDDQDTDTGDVVKLFGGGKLPVKSTSPLYQRRSDFNADNQVNIADVIIGIANTILTSCP